ncbi:reverse transcriptase domain-containing protein [Tanacetum coccineum]|uniref:Reverse transcriptase domain-containing protein n=1 Tax=Tanacetum coccineum TaxID=301880 RepID=A0ABQ5G8V2_9ASTR
MPILLMAVNAMHRLVKTSAFIDRKAILKNHGYRPQGDPNYRASNQMGPLGFPLVQNNQNHFNQNQGYNQNRGNNFNQGNQNYQAPPQNGPSNDLSSYMKASDVNMRVMQNQITSMRSELKKEMDTTLTRQNNAFKNELRNELTNDIKNMMSSFFQMNTASSSGSGSLPSNTVANPRGDLKAITTRSGISYDGPPIPPPFSPLPKVVEREPEVTKDTVQPSTENIQPTTDRLLDPLWYRPKMYCKIRKFHFPADFVVVDYVVDPRVPLILGRPFLRTARALIDVYYEQLTLRVDDEAITFKDGQTLRYSYNNANHVNRNDVINVSCEEYAQEVLSFLDSSKSGNPTPSLDHILSTFFSSPTPFEGGNFILEEIKACLTNDSIPPGIDDAYFDPKRDLLLLEKLLNDDPSPPLPPKKLHFEEIKTIKSSIDDLQA